MAPRLGGLPGFRLKAFEEVLLVRPEEYNQETDEFLTADAAMACLVLYPSLFQQGRLLLLAYDEGTELILFRWALKGASLAQISMRPGSKVLEQEHFYLVGRSERLLQRF